MKKCSRNQDDIQMATANLRNKKSLLCSCLGLCFPTREFLTCKFHSIMSGERLLNLVLLLNIDLWPGQDLYRAKSDETSGFSFCQRCLVAMYDKKVVHVYRTYSTPVPRKFSRIHSLFTKLYKLYTLHMHQIKNHQHTLKIQMTTSALSDKILQQSTQTPIYLQNIMYMSSFYTVN